jgi:hypothetical protein
MQKTAITAGRLTKLIRAAKGRQAIEKGTGSLITDLLVTPFVKNKELPQKVLKGYHGVIGKANVEAGKLLSKAPLVGGAFKTVEKVPLRVREVGKAGVKSIEEVANIPTAKLTRPLEVAQKITMPVLAIFGLEAITRPPEMRSEQELEQGFAVPRRIQTQEDLMSQIKLSQAEVEGVLKQAAEELNLKTRQVDYLVEKLAYYMQREHAEKVAHKFSDRGWFDESEIPFYRDQFMNMSNLDTLEKAAEVLQPPPKTIPLMDDDQEGTEKVADSKVDPVIEYLLDKAAI